MKPKSLKVRIRKIFKDNLDARFNPDNALKVEGRDTFKINVECSLCRVFRSGFACTFCPFRKFETKHVEGCVRWIRRVTRIPIKSGKLGIWSDCIWWYSVDDKEARQQLSLLRRRAEKLITWV